MSTDHSPAPLSGLPEGERADRLVWLGVAAVAISLVVGAIAVLVGVDDGVEPPFMNEASQTAPPRVDERAAGPLRVAGSGSNLSLTRALTERHGSGRVFASIGSGGGVRALLDGVIDIALISRPLRPNERAMGLVEHPYARVPVLVAVHHAVPDRGITGEELIAIYRGEKHSWSDGSRIAVLQRERGDSSHAAVAALLSEFGVVNEQAYREGMWRVVYHDAAMAEALRTTDGAIGLHVGDAGADPTAFGVLAFDGVAPSARSVASGDYPFTKDLSFVTIGEPAAEIRTFIEFSRTEPARSLVRSSGAQPLPEERG